MLLTLKEVDLAYGPKVLFRQASLSLPPQARAGLVGPNGSGKTTLLRILMGEGEADHVVSERRSGVRIGYLPQDGIVLPDRPLLEEVEAAAGDIRQATRQLGRAEADLQELDVEDEEYAECLDRLTHYSQRLEELEAHKLRPRAEAILFGLGFGEEDLQSPCQTFSGGWQMRIALARLLLDEPDLLLFDEPTNHLDLPSLRWLEGFLQSYPGALLVISHDRAFLDKLTSTIHSLENGRIVTYNGNYSSFLEQQAARREQLARAKENQDKAIARTERFIERFRYKATKASQVQSRIKQLEKTERIELEGEAATVHFQFPLSRKGGQRVVQMDNVDKTYGPTRVFKEFSLELQRGDRVGVVGRNGAGKSTLARLLAGVETPDAGTINPGHEIDIGYFAQDQREAFSQQDSVYEVARRGMRGTETHIRSVLGAFLFGEHDLGKPVEVLSGGEKNRLALARLLLSPANFLVLDEPTNHLDHASKEVLQEALDAFPGTVFIVSHDRHFLNPVVNKVLEIRPGSHRWFPGNLDDYLWKLRQEEAAAGAPAGSGTHANGGGTASAANPRERRRRKAQEKARQAPLKKRMNELEGTIARLEKAVAERETAMADKAWFERGETTAAELREYDQWKEDLAAAMKEWESVAAELE